MIEGLNVGNVFNHGIPLAFIISFVKVVHYCSILKKQFSKLTINTMFVFLVQLNCPLEIFELQSEIHFSSENIQNIFFTSTNKFPI